MTEFTATDSMASPTDVTYKPSGIDWLGDIPSHWEVRRLKYCIKGLVSGGTPSMENADFWQDGHIPWVSPKDMKQDVITDSEMKVTHKATEDTNLKLLPPKSILIVVRSGILQRTLPVAITNTEVTINQDLKAVILDDNLFLPEYFFLLLKGLEDYILTSCRKAVATVDSIEIPYLLNIQIPVPPLSEQLQLIDSIESRTSRVESFLAQKQRFIDLLREQKQAIINEAVTKGLYSQQNGTSLVTQGKYHFADSEPWLAGVPNHWEVRRLKNCAMINPTKGNSGFDKESTDLAVFLPMENVSEEGKVDTSISKPITEVWAGYTYFEQNDVILAKITPCFENGKGAVLNMLPTKIGFGSTEFHVLRANADVQPNFLYFITQTYYFRKEGEVVMSGSAGQQRVPTDFIENFPIPVPPLTEQAEIVDYIERETGRIDTLVRKTEREMSLMQEYRQSMVAEAVTGKTAVYAPA